jgi:signal transduction histidine kinase
LYRRYLVLLGVLLLIVAAFLLVLFRGHTSGQAVVGMSHFILLGVLLVVGTATIIMSEQGRALYHRYVRVKEEADFREALLGASPDAYVLLSPQGKVIGSQGVEPLLGIDRVAQWQDVLDALQPAAAEKLQQAFKELQNSKGEDFRQQINLRAGNRALSVIGMRRPASTRGEVLVIWLRDITRLTEEIRRQGDSIHHINSQLNELRSILNNLPHPAWLRTAEGKLSWVNEAYARAVGQSVESAVTDQIELVPVTQRGKGKNIAQVALEKGGVQTEQRHVVIDGQRRLLQIVEGATQTDRVLFGYAQDITHEAELDAELKRHIKAHEEVLENLGTPIAIYGADTRMKFYNRSYQKLWGSDEAFLKTEPNFNEVLEDLRARRRAPEQADFQKYKKERTSLFTSLIEQREDLMHLPDGTTLRIMAVPHPFGGIMFVHEDVTDKLALESSYNTLIAVQRETLDNLAEGVAVFGSDGKLKLYNPAFVRIWRLDEEALVTQPHISDVLELMRPLLDATGNWADLKNDAVTETLDRTTRAGRYECRDGIVIEYSNVPLPDGAVLVSYVNVSDSVRAEKALRESNAALAAADRLKSEFVANVSYQLRTPLNTIMGFAEILANQYFGTLNERQLEYARTMMEASKKLLHLINDVLDLATIEAGRMALNPKSVPVKSLLETAADMTREWALQQSLTITIRCDESVGSFEVDEQRMKQVMFNLVSNAIQYTPPGGHIALSAERQSDWVAIHVEDDGMGIPEEDQERVFDKFERTNAEARQSGAGLGLSLVRSFIELHGGRIVIKSNANQGTRISCFLPVKAPPQKNIVTVARTA